MKLGYVGGLMADDNYLEGKFRVDGKNLKKIIAYIKTNKKFLTLLILFLLNLAGGISVRDIAVVSRTDVNALKQTVQQQGETITTLRTQTTETQNDLNILRDVVNDDTEQLEKAAKLERDRKRRRELEDYNRVRAEKLKKIGQGELQANPLIPAATTAPIKN